MKLKPSIKVTIEFDGRRFNLALIPQPWKGRYWLRYNGKASEKMPECTKTQLCKKIAELLAMEGKK